MLVRCDGRQQAEIVLRDCKIGKRTALSAKPRIPYFRILYSRTAVSRINVSRITVSFASPNGCTFAE